MYDNSGWNYVYIDSAHFLVIILYFWSSSVGCTWTTDKAKTGYCTYSDSDMHHKLRQNSLVLSSGGKKYFDL